MDYPKNNPSVDEDDIQQHIEALIEFLGRNDLEKALKKYVQSKTFHKKRPFYVSQYLVQRHPWFETLVDYKRIRERKGKDSAPSLSLGLSSLAIDSATIFTIIKNTGMPEFTIGDYRQNFLSEDNAYPYLFELKTALHYLQSGGEIRWLESDGKKAEFAVTRSDFVFEVECKYVTFDKGKNFRRRDFFLLADSILPKVSNLGLSGEIHIDSDALTGNLEIIEHCARQVVEAAKRGDKKTCVLDGTAEVTLDLRPRSNLVLDPEAYYSALKIADGATMTVWAPSPILQDPVALSFRCTRSPRIVDGLLQLMKGARKQFAPETPGAIHIFFEGLKEGELGRMNDIDGFVGFNKFFFDSENSKNVVAICYATGPFYRPAFYGRNVVMDGLVFTNPNCPAQPPAGFTFIGAMQD
jgi:hypothetical protein